MPVADPYAIAATAIKAIIDGEFEAEGYSAIHDDLHESLGTKRTEIGVSPSRWSPMARNANVRETYLNVQFYDRWDKQINPEQQVNPLRITGFAARFEEAVQRQQATDSGTGDVWNFDVIEITFPRDPTGNKTRFEAVIRARGNNHGLLESGA